jgi:hypothetical protein
MTTLFDLVAETKRHLLSFQREPMNKLAAAVTPTATTLTVTYDGSAIREGAYLQIGLELVYVWSFEAANKTATVERAQLGSTAAAHAADAVVTVNPKFPDFAIVAALNDDLLDLSSPINGLYAVRETTLTATASSWGYDLSGVTEILEIVDIRTQNTGRARDWTPVTNYELVRAVSTTDFPSGFALFLHEGVQPGRPIRVQYKAPFIPLVSLTDDVEAVSGLSGSAHDIPPMGAAVRMTAPREIKRNFTEAQGDPRRAEEVPPGAVAGSMRSVAALRQGRIVAEAARLAQRYPEKSFLPTASAHYGW